MKNQKIYTPWYYFAIGFTLLLFVMFGPILFSKLTLGPEFNEKSAHIGDTIGGITAPFVNLLAALLVWISFKEQVKANKLLSKETSYNFLNTLIKNFKNSYEDFNQQNDTRISLVRDFNLDDYPIDILISGTRYFPHYTNEDSTLYEIKRIYYNYHNIIIKISGSINLFSTILDNIRNSNLDKNLKTSFLILINNEFLFYLEIISKLELIQGFLTQTKEHFNHPHNTEEHKNSLIKYKNHIESFIEIKEENKN